MVSAAFIYGLMFSGVAENSAAPASFLEGSFMWVIWAVEVLNLGPHGCRGMVWLGIAPGVAWFLIGTVLGSVWAIMILIRRRRSGRQAPRTDYRRTAGEIEARPEYEYFIQEDPERRYLHYEELPLEFAKWLQKWREPKADANASVEVTAGSPAGNSESTGPPHL